MRSCVDRVLQQSPTIDEIILFILKTQVTSIQNTTKVNDILRIQINKHALYNHLLRKADDFLMGTHMCHFFDDKIRYLDYLTPDDVVALLFWQKVDVCFYKKCPVGYLSLCSY